MRPVQTTNGTPAARSRSTPAVVCGQELEAGRQQRAVEVGGNEVGTEQVGRIVSLIGDRS